MRFRTSIDCAKTSNPATRAAPLEAGMKQERIRIVVVLPAPFGPRKPTMAPFSTEKDTSWMAAREP